MNRWADWLRQSEKDLQAAEDMASVRHHEWVAFAAQQSAEKAVKALVYALHGAERGHSITGLLEQLRAAIEIPEAVLDAARALDQVYLTSRYPNGFVSGTPADYFSETTSRGFLDHARTILEFCRRSIP